TEFDLDPPFFPDRGRSSYGDHRALESRIAGAVPKILRYFREGYHAPGAGCGGYFVHGNFPVAISGAPAVGLQRRVCRRHLWPRALRDGNVSRVRLDVSQTALVLKAMTFTRTSIVFLVVAVAWFFRGVRKPGWDPFAPVRLFGALW